MPDVLDLSFLFVHDIERAFLFLVVIRIQIFNVFLKIDHIFF